MEDDVSELTNTANWTMNGTPSMGIGNTPTNINWILSLRARVEGSGTVTLNPQIVSGDSVINLTFNYKREPQYNINKLKIVFPEGFTWSQSSGQISIKILQPPLRLLEIQFFFQMLISLMIQF